LLHIYAHFCIDRPTAPIDSVTMANRLAVGPIRLHFALFVLCHLVLHWVKVYWELTIGGRNISYFVVTSLWNSLLSLSCYCCF